jgi:hypothetical protein
VTCPFVITPHFSGLGARITRLCVSFEFFARIKGFCSSPYVDKWQQAEMAKGAAVTAAPR